MTATESLLPEIINDFFNKIDPKRTSARTPPSAANSIQNVSGLRQGPVTRPPAG